MSEQIEKKIFGIVDHIRHVQENGFKIARRLIEHGNPDLARDLIASVLKHDASKFHGDEWLAFGAENPSPEVLKRAIHFHGRTNAHHPEYWGAIRLMPELHLIELVCDWHARAAEFGTSLRDWINGEGMRRYGYEKEDPVYDNLMLYVKLLCDEPFRPLEVEPGTNGEA